MVDFAKSNDGKIRWDHRYAMCRDLSLADAAKVPMAYLFTLVKTYLV